MDNFSLDQVVTRYGIAEFMKRAELVEPQLKDSINRIAEYYKNQSVPYDAIAQRFLLGILQDIELKFIHSARYRIKDRDSLAVKIVKKKALLPIQPSEDYEVEKYRPLDCSNYYKIMMDLIGIRILIRYRSEWYKIHTWIRDHYYQGNEYYVKDCIKDYKDQPPRPFIAEKPKLYYRSTKDLAFYKQIDKDFYDFIESKEGYNSIHYIINNDGKYIEIQVRTIFDEAWSECTHDLVYKNKSHENKLVLQYLSQCLSQQTISAELISNMMYIIANNGDDYDTIDKLANLPDIINSFERKDIDTTSEGSAQCDMDDITSLFNKMILHHNDKQPLFDGHIQNFLLKEN